jgi:putative NADPH-quinone reductase
MKKLVIITHPDIENSLINRTWIAELRSCPKEFEVHSLYKKYPTLEYDIEAEQALLADFEEIIFQFPIHWYSTPFALKKYIDQVFAFGWAFGPGGDKLKGKRIGLAVSAGGNQESYENGLTLEYLLNDVRLTFEYCGCAFTHMHTFFGAMFEPKDEAILENTKAYVDSFRSSHVEADT